MVLWLFVDQEDNILVVGLVTDSAAIQWLGDVMGRQGQEMGLSFATGYTEREDFHIATNLWFTHLGITPRPDGAAFGTWIRQFGSDLAGLRRVLREEYLGNQGVYMPPGMITWLTDSEADDRMRYTTHGGLAGRHFRSSRPASFVFAMAEHPPPPTSTEASSPPPPPSTSSSSATPTTPSPPVATPSNAEVKNLALTQIGEQLPHIGVLDDLTQRQESLHKLIAIVDGLNTKGFISASDIRNHPTLRRLDDMARETDKMVEQRTKVFTGEQTPEQTQKMEQMMANPEFRRMVMAGAETMLRRQSTIDAAMEEDRKKLAEASKKHADEVGALKRKIEELEKERPMLNPVAAGWGHTLYTPAGMQALEKQIHAAVPAPPPPVSAAPTPLQQHVNDRNLEAVQKAVAAGADVPGQTESTHPWDVADKRVGAYLETFQKMGSTTTGQSQAGHLDLNEQAKISYGGKAGIQLDLGELVLPPGILGGR